MIKPKLSKLAGPTWVCASALLGLSTLLPIENARAQVPPGCLNGGMASVINVSPTIAHIGDTVTITHLGVSLGGSSCDVTNGQSFIMYPNGNPAFVAGPPVGNGLNGIQEYETNFFINQGQTLDCLAGPTAAGACALVTLTYTIQAGDVNKPLSFTTPRGFTSGSVPGTPKTVKFLCVSDGLLTDSGGTLTAGGQGNAAVTILTPLISVTKQCVTNCPPFSSPYGQPIDFLGTVCNTGDTTLIGVTVTDSPPATITFATTTSSGNPFPAAGGGTLTNGECVSFSGSYQPTANLCGPFSDTVIASGTDTAPSPKTVFATNSAVCTVCTSPAIAVTKACPTGPVQPGGTLTFTGTVTNTGNVPLTNVIVVNNQPAPNTVVLGPITLAPGAGQSFSGSYTVPLDSCGPYADTVTATGSSVCGSSVTNTFTAVCPGTNSPNIAVTKACPTGPVQPGGTLNFTGTVTNTGNITLTNVIVRNNQPAPNTVVLGPITLAPGAGQSFSGSYTVPLDSCGPYADTVVATGTEKCFGHSVTNSFTAVCPGTNSPSIAVTKACPPAPVQPGGTLNFTGTVTNTGNITLTNVIVVNNQPAPNTVVLGPITLAPGAGQSFSGSYTVPLDSCGPYPDTVMATGAEKCFGHSVTNTFTAVCPGTNSPNIAVTKSCPPAPVQPGGTLNFTGTVTNTGNITLTNVIVRNNQPAPNTVVLGPITLAPGAGATFSGSYTVPLDSCGPYADTVVATGAEKCFGHSVTNTFTAVCPGTNSPSIAVTKACPPAPVQPGGTLNFTGTVTNTGNITLTNVIVVNNQPAPNTVVLGPITLAPGAGQSFSGSYTVPLDSCGPYPDTVMATGAEKCFGHSVTNSFTAVCPGTNSPNIAVTKACPPAPVQPGGTLNFTGTVTNTGNITLTNVIVVNNQPAPNTVVLGPITLAPGAGQSFSGSYTVPLDSCGPYPDTVVATGAEKCFGHSVTNSFTAVCPGTNTPNIVVVKLCPPGTTPVNNNLTVNGFVTNTGNITLTNVVVTNVVPAIGRTGRVLGPISLAPGGFAAFSDTYNVGTNCPSISDTVTASGADKCFGHIVSATAGTNCPVACAPNICVNKEVACFLGTNTAPSPIPIEPIGPGERCGAFGKFAVGVSGDTQDPAFCYSITVSNCGSVALTNVMVVDDQYGDLTTNFFPNWTPSLVFPVNGSATFTFKTELPPGPNGTINLVTNVVNASGFSIASGQRTNAFSQAVAEVVPASISCLKQYTLDGGPLTNNVVLTDQNPHTVVWYLTVFNTGLATVEGIQVTDVTSNLGCNVSLVIPTLAAGANTGPIALCTNAAFVCTNGVTNSITLFAEHFAYSTNGVCTFDINGSNIVVRSQSPCEATLICTPPNACRVTGGGRQDSPLVYPLDVRYVTHGGQVGAPVGDRICTVLTNFFLGNPCIHGRWTHVRHEQGGLKGNFHARFYDTLDCACLDTNVTAVTTNIPGVDGAANQTYVNLVYGPGTVVGGRCNPGNRVLGPEPRPAPANKIVFTGVGDWADPNGHRAPRSVLFRVDIEDRGEPGGSHPKGGTPPPDRYRIRIWVLSSTELQELNGSGPDRYLINFRNAISACNGINVQDGASVPNGTAAFGVRAPNIDDGGELERGNHQIHPAIMPCDPLNPVGPGLPKP